MKKNYFKYIVIAVTVAFISSCAEEDPLAPPTDKYIGQWTCKETQGTISTSFTITISRHGSEDTLDVYNFNNLGSNEKAIFIVNDNSITIPSQIITGFSISGYGTYSNEKLNLNYSADMDSYTAVCSK